MENFVTTQTERGRLYTDRERADALAALAANNGNLSKTAALIGVPRQTLAEWRDADAKQPAEVQRLRAKRREELAERFEQLAEVCLDIVEEKAHQMSPKDAAIVGAIAIDKMALLRGEPGAIIETTTTTEQEARAAAIRSRYRAKLLPPKPSAN